MKTLVVWTTAALGHTALMRLRHRARFGLYAVAAGCCALAPVASLNAADTVSGKASIQQASAPAPTATKVPTANSGSAGPLLSLGIGDQVSMQVYGRPEMSLTTYVSDDGTISIPLAGNVPVAGLSPAKAAEQVAAAFSRGKYLVNPQVTIVPVQFRGPQVSVLGAVRTPGRFLVESKSTLLDVLAMAGGIDEKGADTVVLLRPDNNGKVTRSAIDLKGLGQANTPLPTLILRGGDSIFVPPAEQFYLTGEVRVPNTYRLQPGMTIVQAIALGGGITRAGSNSRIEIKRRKPDNTYVTLEGKPNDVIQANDVLRIKESFF